MTDKIDRTLASGVYDPAFTATATRISLYGMAPEPDWPRGRPTVNPEDWIKPPTTVILTPQTASEALADSLPSLVGKLKARRGVLAKRLADVEELRAELEQIDKMLEAIGQK